MNPEKFIDTSTLVPIANSNLEDIQKYYLNAVKDGCTCSLVRKEFFTTVIYHLLSLYDHVKSKKSIQRKREHSHEKGAFSRESRNHTNMITVFLERQKTTASKFDNQKTKAKLEAVRNEINYLISILERYNFLKPDNLDCPVDNLNLDDITDKTIQDIRKFIAEQNKKCKINELLQEQQNKNLFKGMDNVKKSKKCSEIKTKRTGYKDIVENLKEISKNSRQITCKNCSKIADYIIALLCPPDMNLIHTDHSFCYLMPALNKQNHTLLQSKASLTKQP